MHKCVGACITDSFMISFTVCNSVQFFFLRKVKEKQRERETALEFLDSETGTHPRHDLFSHGDSPLSWWNEWSLAFKHCLVHWSLPAGSLSTGLLVLIEPLFCTGHPTIPSASCYSFCFLCQDLSSGCKSILRVPDGHGPGPCWVLAFGSYSAFFDLSCLTLLRNSHQ